MGEPEQQGIHPRELRVPSSKRKTVLDRLQSQGRNTVLFLLLVVLVRSLLAHSSAHERPVVLSLISVLLVCHQYQSYPSVQFGTNSIASVAKKKDFGTGEARHVLLLLCSTFVVVSIIIIFLRGVVLDEILIHSIRWLHVSSMCVRVTMIDEDEDKILVMVMVMVMMMMYCTVPPVINRALSHRLDLT